MRLGEALVQRRIITEEQLARALDAQLIFGAHLGTCLIELGYLDEERLGDVLAEILQVGYARRDRLEEIPADVIGILTPVVADRHKAVPFDLTDGLLRVAMVNPRHQPSLEEISSVTGCRVEAWVAPEVRIAQALERHYDVPRRLRYIVLASRLDEGRAAAAPGQVEATTRRAAALAAAAQGSAAPEYLDAGLLLATPGSCDGVARPRPSRTGAPGGDRLHALADDFCRAADGAALGRVTLDHAVRGMTRCILFGVSGGAAVLGETRGLSLDRARTSRLRFPITSDSIFGLLCGEPYYRGPIPDEASHRAFFEALGVAGPREALIIPVYRGDRIAALFYGDAGADGAITGETEEYLRLMRMLAIAMDLVAVKRRLLTA